MEPAAAKEHHCSEKEVETIIIAAGRSKRKSPECCLTTAGSRGAGEKNTSK